jgi:hypothetical protein
MPGNGPRTALDLRAPRRAYRRLVIAEATGQLRDERVAPLAGWHQPLQPGDEPPVMSPTVTGSVITRRS